MPNVMNNECLVSCRNCNAVVTATWSPNILSKGWRLKDSKGKCPTCRLPIRLKGLESMLCPHCGKLVERTADNRCLNCHKTLVQAPIRGQVECPECGMLVAIPKGSSGTVICAVCGTALSTDLIERKLGQAAAEQEQYIRLPDVSKMLREDRAIWKHPQSTFPFKSRMQVNEGTSALFLQNGICKEPREPGNYLLEDSDLDKSQKLDAAMADKPVVFNTDIYCVLQDLPEIDWGVIVYDLKVSDNRSENRAHPAIYSAGSGGQVALRVCDAKAYARYLGFKPVSISTLVNNNPEPYSSDGILLQTTRNAFSDALYACLNGMDRATLERLLPIDIRDNLTVELNQRLAEYGLRVRTLLIETLSIEKSDSAMAADQILTWAQSEYNWHVRSARLHDYIDRSLYADMDFDGSFRLRVTDETRFFSVSEVRAFAAKTDISEYDVKDYFRSKVQRILNNALVITAQEQIDRGSISDILDRSQYVAALRDCVRNRVNEELELDGLALSMFSVNMPCNIVNSDALNAQLDQPRREQAIRRAVESALPLKTDAVRVHPRDDKSNFVDLSFRGICNLRIREEDTFFRLSEVQGFLTDNRAVSESAISDYYAKKINAMFQEVISRSIQSIVDQTNADIREINRLTGMLKRDILTGMVPRIESWGLELESLDLNGIDTVGGLQGPDKQNTPEEYRRRFRLHEEHIVQETEIDMTRRRQQTEFMSDLNAPNNQRLLNDIIQKIAESDLDWQQKLDAYDRLRRRINAETDVEIRQTEAGTALKITRDRANFFLDVAGRKLQLSAEEAQLMERIDRCAEAEAAAKRMEESLNRGENIAQQAEEYR